MLTILEQLQYLDYSLYKSLLWIAEHDVTNLIYETFSVETTTNTNTTSSSDNTNNDGSTTTTTTTNNNNNTSTTTNNTNYIDLCYNGHNINVTEHNKYKYIILLIQYKLKYSIENNLNSFLNGFHTIIPKNIIKNSNFNENELNLILNGKERIQIIELQAYCIYPNSNLGFNDIHDSIRWFWNILHEFNENQKRKILQFWTGTGKNSVVDL